MVYPLLQVSSKRTVRWEKRFDLLLHKYSTFKSHLPCIDISLNQQKCKGAYQENLSDHKQFTTPYFTIGSDTFVAACVDKLFLTN